MLTISYQLQLLNEHRDWDHEKKMVVANPRWDMYGNYRTVEEARRNAGLLTHRTSDTMRIMRYYVLEVKKMVLVE